MRAGPGRAADRAPAAAEEGAFDYELPPELIAQRPPPERDGGRMMVVARGGGAEPCHAAVRDLPEWLRPGDLLVVNRSRVIRARLRGRRLPGGGAVELLLLAPREGAAGSPAWRALARPARRLRVGQILELGGASGRTGRVEIVAVRSGGEVEVELPPVPDPLTWLETMGEPPLPPYIRRPAGPLAGDAERYQTVYAREPGSIAAPTAGLHLSEGLLSRLEARGIERGEVVLHVGPATFLAGRPDRTPLAVEPERYEIPPAARQAVQRARERGGRVVAVGTTTTRALEAAARAGWPSGPQETNLVLAPGARFEVVDGLLTNLHLPRSSLLALVAAFAGVETVRRAYRLAVAERYRFYSYGDAMLLLDRPERAAPGKGGGRDQPGVGRSAGRARLR